MVQVVHGISINHSISKEIQNNITSLELPENVTLEIQITQSGTQVIINNPKKININELIGKVKEASGCMFA